MTESECFENRCLYQEWEQSEGAEQEKVCRLLYSMQGTDGVQ